LKVIIKIDRLAPLGERSGGARSTSSILAERFTSGQWWSAVVAPRGLS